MGPPNLGGWGIFSAIQALFPFEVGIEVIPQHERKGPATWRLEYLKYLKFGVHLLLVSARGDRGCGRKVGSPQRPEPHATGNAHPTRERGCISQS